MVPVFAEGLAVEDGFKGVACVLGVEEVLECYVRTNPSS